MWFCGSSFLEKNSKHFFFFFAAFISDEKITPERSVWGLFYVCTASTHTLAALTETSNGLGPCQWWQASLWSVFPKACCHRGGCYVLTCKSETVLKVNIPKLNMTANFHFIPHHNELRWCLCSWPQLRKFSKLNLIGIKDTHAQHNESALHKLNCTWKARTSFCGTYGQPLSSQQSKACLAGLVLKNCNHGFEAFWVLVIHWLTAPS